ncbi:hypothetical protein Nepgr_012254 [Nepenthes gracilis]|uniref:Uncharacterized protein n=1 Tax=Nepenthes gracilis TaxID=150966 RepID=A0AAD3SFP5_NEPGR|nr:hypothetical protein Nepgr_012254 [Nepenthes gracilis]
MDPNIASEIAKAAAAMKTSRKPNRAYVTFLAGNGDYVNGVVGLAKGLKEGEERLSAGSRRRSTAVYSHGLLLREDMEPHSSNTGSATASSARPRSLPSTSTAA